MPPYSPDPREARCVRHVRDGAHVWLDIGRPEGPVCKYCRRQFGRRYKARAA